MKTRARNQRGNMLVLIISITAAVTIPVLICLCKMAPHMSARGRTENAVEAAALLAAKDISRITEKDSHFGFVSISNHPPTGKATKAQDGEPLPVLGINTIIGTLRQNAIIADQLKNSTLESLIDDDMKALEVASNGLNVLIKEATKANPDEHLLVDVNGEYVRPMDDVRKFLNSTLPANVKIQSITMSSGWLDNGSDTTVQVPKPVSKAMVSIQQMDEDKYQAFKNLPVGKRNFMFAGIGKQPHLVSARKFKPDDGHHLCTIIKLECTLIDSQEPDKPIKYAVCSQPSSQEDEGTRGSMTVRFAQKPVPGLGSWSDFLASGSFTDHGILNFDITGGDYPYDPKAQMRLSYDSEPRPGTSQQFAEHLYNWLKNGRLQPNVDAVLSMVVEPFQNEPNLVYTYSFESDGSISRKVSSGEDFTRAVTADGQETTLADTNVKNGANAVIMFRDNVASTSGKHGGQPLAGYPTDANNGNANHEDLAKEFAKRGSHKDGLAVDIEIGGTDDKNTQRDQQLTMQHRTGTPHRI